MDFESLEGISAEDIENLYNEQEDVVADGPHIFFCNAYCSCGLSEYIKSFGYKRIGDSCHYDAYFFFAFSFSPCQGCGVCYCSGSVTSVER